MNKTKEYARTYFSAEVIQDAIRLLEKTVSASPGNIESEQLHLRATISDESWKYDDEAEFFADYRKATYATLCKDYYVKSNGSLISFSIDLTFYDRESKTEVTIDAPTRAEIERVFNEFESHAKESQLPETKDDSRVIPTIFIGHEHSQAWRDLKDHLHEQHGFPVEAYETGARAGHAIRDIIQEMMSKSSFALLVLTGDDKMEDGTFRARQNVVHEAGLFQGHLGFSRAIVLIAESVEGFSNLASIHQLRFSKNNIKEIYGDVLATIRREFSIDP